MKSNNINLHKLLSMTLVSFGFIPLIPGSKKGVLILLLLMLSLISFIKSNDKKIDYKSFIINTSLYIFYLFSLFYTENLIKGIKIITETRLSAFLLPLIFLLLSTNKSLSSKKIITKFKSVFIYSTFLLSIIYFLYIPFVEVSANPFFDFPSVYFFRNTIKNLPILGLDPIYYSLYLGVSIIFILTNKWENKKTKILFTITFFMALFVISSKMTIIALLLISFIYFIKKTKTFTKIIIISLGFVLLIGIYNIPTINTRAKELINPKTFIEYDRHNSTSIRINIIKCSTNIVSNNIIFGVGVGDVKDKLIDCYKDISNDFVFNRYNSHNQYISILLSTGVIGFIFFIYFLYYNFNISRGSIDNSFFYILFFYCINFISENILERQNGIILFYFLVCYFSYFALNNKKELVN